MYEVLLVYINVDTLPCIWITQSSFAWQICQFDNFLGFYQKKKGMLESYSLPGSAAGWIGFVTFWHLLQPNKELQNN